MLTNPGPLESPFSGDAEGASVEYWEMGGFPATDDEVRAAAMRVSKAVRSLAHSEPGWMFKTPENRELGLASMQIRASVEGYSTETA